MYTVNTRLTIGIYLFAVFALLYSRPTFIFNEDSNLKKFGVNSDNTCLMPLWLIFTLFAVISYYVITISV